MAEHSNKGHSTHSNQGQFNQGNANKGGQNQGNQGQGGQNQGVAQMAKETASSMSQSATGVLHAASDQAQHAAESVAGGMRTLAGTIREHVPSQGMLGTAASSVADSLESGGRYLQEEGLSGMVDDAAGMVRRNPISCMLCCVGFGFILGRLLSSNGSHQSRSY